MIPVEPFVAAACVAVAAWTLAKEEIFREVREFLQGCHKNASLPWLCRKFAFMPTCEFCGSFWVSLLAVAVLDYKLLRDDWRGYAVAQFFTWGLAVAYLAVFQLLRTDIKVNQATAEVVGQAKPTAAAKQALAEVGRNGQ